MDARANPSPPRKPGPGPAKPRPAPEPPPRLAAAQRLGLVSCCLILAAALALNSPLGRDVEPSEEWGAAHYLVILAANLGASICAVGLALGRPGPAWGGAAGFLGMAFLLPRYWFVVPLALLLLGCVLAWEMRRPKPPPQAQAPPQWIWAPPPPMWP